MSVSVLSPADLSRLRASGKTVLVVQGVAYDVTDFVAVHPGGEEVLRAACQHNDATAQFLAFHDLALLHTKEVRERVIGRVPSRHDVAPPDEAGTSKLSRTSNSSARSQWWDFYSPEELQHLPSLSAVHAAASVRMPASLLLHFDNGNEDNQSLRANENAWERWNLMPRVCRDVRQPDLSTTILGCPVASPVFVAPFASAGAAHPSGELAIARACGSRGLAFVVPHYSAFPIAEVANAYREKHVSAAAPLFFQFYAPRDSAGMLHRPYTQAAFKHAEECGFRAVMVTVDSPVLSIRERTYGNAAWVKTLQNLPGGGFPPIRGFETVDQQFEAKLSKCASLSWDDAAWMARVSSLKVVLKGVMCPEDAAEAVRAGLHGIVVSNHGGRQMDGTAGTADVLRECVHAAREAARVLQRDEIEVFVDGGVRRGKDVLRALALGAHGVMVGRPIAWGLGVGGEEGVGVVLDLLKRELANSLQLCGERQVKNLPFSLVRPRL